jgi:hypothetical protein
MTAALTMSGVWRRRRNEIAVWQSLQQPLISWKPAPNRAGAPQIIVAWKELAAHR